MRYREIIEDYQQDVRRRVQRLQQHPEFISWFRGSKVVDSNGLPQPMYHGTFHNIHKWDPTYGEIGIHFAAAPSIASVFTDNLRGGEAARIYPVYLRIKNPIRIPDFVDWSPGDVVEWLQKKGYLTEQEGDKLLAPLMSDAAEWKDAWLRDLLLQKGYDGFVYKNRFEKSTNIGETNDCYIAFKTDQIRSAITLQESILFEARSAPLYHFMAINKAINVFQSDTLEGRWEHNIPGLGRRTGTSLSRDPRFSFNKPVRLILNQEKLSRRYRMIPLDAEHVHRNTYGGYNGLPPDYNRHYDRRINRRHWQFAEEFLIGDVKELHRYVLVVELIHGSMRGADLDTLLQDAQTYCYRFGIPLRND